MALFYLIRHGETDHVGKILSGRMPGVHLNKWGRTQAEQIALPPIEALYSSPLERAMETAAPIADSFNMPIEEDDAFNEVDFGAWTGMTYADLNTREDWQAWNARRGTAAPPGGETMRDAQTRAVARLNRLAEQYPGERMAVVSHAEIIRAVLLHALNMRLDDFWRVEISPASVSVVEVQPGNWRVLAVNWLPDLPD